MPLKLSKADALRAAKACRAQVHIRERDVAGIGDNTAKDALLAEARAYERLVKVFEDQVLGQFEPAAKVAAISLF